MDGQEVIEAFLRQPTEESFNALFVAVYGRVRRYFLLRGTNATTAEDLAQRVLYQVYCKAVELADVRSFQGWLFAIARNELLQYWRRGRSRIETVELEPLAEQLTSAFDLELRAEFAEWLSLLEPNERELVLLRFVEGLSYEELAEAFKVPLGTVKSRLYAVREKLLRQAITLRWMTIYALWRLGMVLLVSLARHVFPHHTNVIADIAQFGWQLVPWLLTLAVAHRAELTALAAE